MDSSAEERPIPSVGGKKNIRAALITILLVVFLGSLLIWTMKPTDTYQKQWAPKFKEKLNQSPQFGSQGVNLVLFMSPVLFAAIVGCIYLHLEKKISDIKIQSNKKKGMSSLRQPVLVKGPLGIVSTIELVFFIMFIALLVWYLVMGITKSIATVTPEAAAAYGETVWQGKLWNSGTQMGLVGTLSLVFLFFPVTRGSSILPLFGLTSESSIKYHIWVGHITMILFTAHGLCYIVIWITNNRIAQMLRWAKNDVSNLAGEISLLCGLCLWATTYPSIRRKMFELFFYIHQLYILFLAFFIFHVGLAHVLSMLPGFYLFLIDRYLRFLQSRENVKLLSTRLLSSQVIELNFAKSPSLSYNPTSILFLNVPSISKLQWHPFTITSNSSLESNIISTVVKVDGSWTKKLYQILSSPSLERLGVSLEGPYGPVSTNFLSYDTLVLVSGGSGITPFSSIIRELILMSNKSHYKTPNVILISSFKYHSELAMLDFLLPASGTPFDISDFPIQIEAYITREKQPAANDSTQVIRSIHLNPLPTDKAVYAILGPNSWLWLATIIACSFLIFLLLIGLISSGYIYPIDHNTYQVYPFAARSAISMLVIVLSIAIVASVPVFLIKKHNAKEVSTKQWFSDGDRELESLPHMSFVQAANVHYGGRPNLREIISGIKGQSVGVLASGPKNLRNEVANICSSVGYVMELNYKYLT